MTLLAAYVHDLNPIAIPLPDWPFLPAGIRWYGLSYLLGFVIAYLLIRRVTRVGRSTVKPEEVGDMIVTMAIGVVLGGRLGYVTFYMPSLWGFVDHFPYWGVLAINQGGMSFHGGMLGAVLGALWFARRGSPGAGAGAARPASAGRESDDKLNRKQRRKNATPSPISPAPRTRHTWSHILDLAALGTPMGLLFGRIANFVNGELYGRACPENFRLAVKFPQEMLTWKDDAALYDPAILCLLPPDVVARGRKGDLIPAVIDQIQHGNHALRDAVAPLLTPRYPSQLFEAALEGLALMILLVFVWRKPRKPLVVGGWFAVGYAIARIIVECFRQPDPQIGYLAFHTTEGQWLSFGLLLAGIAIVVLAQRRNVPPMGGWKRNAE